MEPSLQPQAILRGRFMKAAARMEWEGIPMDTVALGLLQREWQGIQDGLIRQVDADYGVYDGRSFRQARFAQWLHGQGIRWPCLDSGGLDLKDDTFRDMAKIHPQIGPLRELRVAMSQMRLSDLAVGPDGRNRVLLGPSGIPTTGVPSVPGSVYPRIRERLHRAAGGHHCRDKPPHGVLSRTCHGPLE